LIQILPYRELLKILDMTNVRELEDLIIDAIYLDILRGKLDQKQGQLEVEYTMGRDLEPDKLENILFALRSWQVLPFQCPCRFFICSRFFIVLRSSTTTSALATLDEKIGNIAKEANIKKRRQTDYENQLQTILKDILDRKEKQSLANRHATATFSDRDNIPMDIDEPPLEFAKGKNRKYVVSLYQCVYSNPSFSKDTTRNKSQNQEEKQILVNSSTDLTPIIAYIIPLLAYCRLGTLTINQYDD